MNVALFGKWRRPVVPPPPLSDFGIPREAELPQPWKNSGPAAAAQLHSDTEPVGYALFTLPPWRRRHAPRGDEKAVAHLHLMVVWVPPKPGIDFEDAVVTDLDEYPIAEGILQWRGEPLRLRWLIGREATDVVAEHFAS